MADMSTEAFDEIQDKMLPIGSAMFSSSLFSPATVPPEVVGACRERIAQEWPILLVYLIQATHVDQEIRDMAVRLMRRPLVSPTVKWPWLEAQCLEKHRDIPLWITPARADG